MKISHVVKEKMNLLGQKKIPFVFIIDYQEDTSVVIPLSEINTDMLLYDFEGISNTESRTIKSEKSIQLEVFPVDYTTYLNQFNRIQHEIASGNTYLLNLTTSTPIKSKYSLKEIFHCAKAKYRLWLDDKFVCFSPETFVKIIDNKIFSYPMKGTIDGSIPNAESIILSDTKESSEHYTIVDLIRNDLNLVSKNVTVEQFRYIEKVETHSGSILQVSSRISGILNNNWNMHIGDIFDKLLPAGSISGAPKERTIEIINLTETHSRGFYTGIAGIFDGNTVNSMVMIRFIEKNDNNYYYKSGGGITSMSDARKEYEELIQKIYVPVY
ncbi:aminodeoxychorismate synthase component I [Apibacter sp. HY039]|uniref:aminodeoxychorismate synthase component I n=1 Tax=Apibacter sp. HY039 TaxID=2501476 RepID=UPI000FEB6319|nr:aminodeoxychorismate synthase component I [Apibacter sp. HY039]